MQPKAEPSEGTNGTSLSGVGIVMRFGGLAALDGVDVRVNTGEILGLIGPNGSGKTTLVNVLSGFLQPSGGRVRLKDKDVTGSVPHRLARSGVARTFQDVRLFSGLTVFENLESAALTSGIRRIEARQRVRDLVERMDLSEIASRPASGLPVGAERRVGMARAFIGRPTFLLLDEPAAGLNEVESEDVLKLIVEARDSFGCGVLLVEHDMEIVMRVCERLHVLDHGRTISEGAPARVRRDAAVIEAYLGAEGGRAVAED